MENERGQDAQYVRIASIVRPDGILPISRSTFYAGVRAGRYPKPLKLGPRISVWRRDDILSILEGDQKVALSDFTSNEDAR